MANVWLFEPRWEGSGQPDEPKTAIYNTKDLAYAQLPNDAVSGRKVANDSGTIIIEEFYSPSDTTHTWVIERKLLRTS